jgi:spermidine synthase
MKNLLLILAFLEGGLVMLLELLVPSVTMPIFGRSIILWSIVISLSVGSLATGYFLGGRLVKVPGDLKLRIHKLFLINGISLFVGLLLLTFMNTGADVSYALFTMTITVLILIIPLILFGATTPIIIQVTKASLGEGVVGKIFFYSTIGGVIFCLLTGFYFIPQFGVTKTLILATMLTLLGSFAHYYLHKIGRLVHIAIGGVLIALVFIEFNPLPQTEEFKVLHQSEGINGQLLVFDLKNENFESRMLLINRMGQTWVAKNNYAPVWSYAGILANLCSNYPENSRVLLLGLGGGAVARTIAQVNNQNVDAVEFDKRIIDVANNFFGLKDYKHKINVYYDDARRHVKASRRKYSVVIVDAFNGEIAPSHVLSKEAITEMMALLKKDGALLINFNGFVSGIEGVSSRSLYATLQDLGLNIKVYTSMEEGESNRNLLFAITQPSVDADWSKNRFELQFAGKQFTPEDFLLDPEIFLQGTSHIITDDLPIMETLNRHAAKRWREDYLKNFTLKHKEEYNLPLFR